MATPFYANSSFTNTIALNTAIDPQRLSREVQSSAISINLLYISQSSTGITFTFASSLTGGDTTLLNAIVASHPNNSVAPPTTFPNAYYGITGVPGTGNDERSGYFAMDSWVRYTPGNTATKEIYTCYNGYTTNANWVKQIKVLDDLNDVVISGATANNVLQYNGSNWINVPANTITTVANKDMQTATTATAQTSAFNPTTWTTPTSMPTLTTSNTKNMDYYLSNLFMLSDPNFNAILTYRFNVNGVGITGTTKQVLINQSHTIVVPMDGYISNVGNGQLIKMEVLRGLSGATAVAGSSATIERGSMCIFGF